MIDRRTIGRRNTRSSSPKPVIIENMTAGDSSGVDLDDDTTSGSDSADNGPRPPIRPRSSYTRQERRNKRDKMHVRDDRLRDRYYSEAEIRRRKTTPDFVIFEYLENGDLSSLINRLGRSRKNHKIPNRVLWSFWLCCKSRTITISKGTC